MAANYSPKYVMDGGYDVVKTNRSNIMMLLTHTAGIRLWPWPCKKKKGGGRYTNWYFGR